MKIQTSFLLASLLFGSTAALAHGDEEHAKTHKFDPSQVQETAFGREGDPKQVVRTIRLDMADSMRFTPDRVAIRRGQTVRFVVHNRGQLLHEMVLGTVDALKAHAELMKKFPNMQHADPNMAHVRPGKTGVIVWQFTQAGEFQFACLQPGHFEAGMVGRLVVQ
jgi:uncharacterized cupredoxin-like copper-binding protein